MKLYTFYNDDFARLKARFAATLKDDYDVGYEKMNISTQQKWCGGDAVWLFKSAYVIDCIERNWDDIILIMDIDIQFLRPTKEIFLDAVRDRDIVFQQDPGEANPTINIGVLVLRCNKSSLDLWKRTFEIVRDTHLHDQSVVRELLTNPQNVPGPCAPLDIRWGILPRTVWGYAPSLSWDVNMPSDMVLHHATWARTEPEKLDQMDMICRRLRRPALWALQKWLLKVVLIFRPLWLTAKRIVPR